MTAPDLDARCRALAVDLGLGEPRAVTPLGGGVASDIAVMDMPGRRLCAKFALAKLKVAEDWFAPVHRNRAEYEWLRFAGSVVPGAAPALHGWSAALDGFAMEHVAGEDVALWKAVLLSGAADTGEAGRVGDVLGRVHAASTAPGFDAAPFDNRDDFHALRIEPYLLFTAGRHPDLAPRLTALADDLHARGDVLVHGDVSPKNVLLRGGEPVLLDAECATMGDAAFDVAFCLNHLILKAIHVDAGYLRAAATLWERYAPHVAWEAADALEGRVAALAPALMLARVDGKSPVEYLSDAERDRVRALSRPLVARPPRTIPALLNAIEGSPP